MTDTDKYAILDRLHAAIVSRKGADPEKSHVARLFAKGRAKMAQKVGEEAVETVIAAMQDDRGEVVSESADLLFHLLVLWEACGVDPADVLAELVRREGVSGFDLKRSEMRKLESPAG
jgi:phosphoribosyl-ATP pyrophosphohydrolase